MKFTAGQKVLINPDEAQYRHECYPGIYPAPGTVGTVFSDLGSLCVVDWPRGTSSEGKRYIPSFLLKPAKEGGE